MAACGAQLTGWSVSATPAVVNGVVYVVDGLGGLTAYDAAGPSHCTVSPACPRLWGADTGSGVGGTPAVIGGVLYVGNGEQSGLGL